jgi:hypothetical protein
VDTSRFTAGVGGSRGGNTAADGKATITWLDW